MGILGSFARGIRSMLTSGYDGEVNPELDHVRSVFPRLATSGYWNWGAGSVIQTSVLLVASSKVFDMKTLVITNRDVANYVYLTDGPGATASVGGFMVGQSATLIAMGLEGYVFASGVFASLAGSLCEVKVGGLIRDTDSGA